MSDKGGGLASNIDKLKDVAGQSEGGKRFETRHYYAVWGLKLDAIDLMAFAHLDVKTVPSS